MNAFDRLLLVKTKLVSLISKMLGVGAGATWPGEIALTLRPAIASSLAKELKAGVVLIAGTNGKTTTSLMIKKILEAEGNVIVHNASGANLLNGIVSAFITHADFLGRVYADWGVFEVDENSIPVVLQHMTPTVVVLLNLFRDQLDRYGEVDVIVEKWEKALRNLPGDTIYILNSDDPGVAFLGTKLKGQVRYFGVNDAQKFLKVPEHATDSTFCPNCGSRLSYDGIYYSHIGHWQCRHCGLKRPSPEVSRWQSALPGLYNEYNTLAAVAVAKALGVKETRIKKALTGFAPAFGRQETFAVNGRNVRIFLSKNPAGFNASIRTVLEEGAQNVLLVLNDRIPDGRDVSWIWDVDIEMFPKTTKIWVSGDRVYDMALRVKYADLEKYQIHPLLSEALDKAIEETAKGETLYVLPTYSAMLEVRQFLTGRKIL